MTREHIDEDFDAVITAQLREPSPTRAPPSVEQAGASFIAAIWASTRGPTTMLEAAASLSGAPPEQNRPVFLTAVYFVAVSTLSRPARPRERVLAAAAELFYANGVDGVGVDTISERSGVSKSTLYRHFPTKAHLIAAYLQEGHESRLAEWKEAIGTANGDAMDRILSVFDWLAQWFESRGFRGCRFINAAVQIQDPYHPAYSVPRRHKEEIGRLFVDLGREAGASDPLRLASELSLLVDGAVVRALLEGDSAAAYRAKELATLALLAAGLKPAAAAS